MNSFYFEPCLLLKHRANALHYRKLEKSGIKVSEIGFGCWGIGGLSDGNTSYGDTDDSVSLRALATALDCGVNFFDTAPPYGSGHSETLLGKAIQGKRDQIVIATKLGVDSFGHRADFSIAGMRRMLEESLRRLGTDYVDLVQLHSPPANLLMPGNEALDALLELKTEGKTRAIGISAKKTDDVISILHDSSLDTIQINLNLLDQRAVHGGLLSNLGQGIMAIARTPLCFGFLSGTIEENVSFSPGDHRKNWSNDQIKKWVEGSRIFIQKVATDTGSSPAQVALRYCLSFQSVATTIPGMMCEKEVIENVAASEQGPLDDTTLAEISATYSQSSFFVSK